jgi:flavin-dependent dehydrogenase
MDVDVAIIGGGPAGCAAALALRSRGLAVTVIAAPTRREQPTETAVPPLSRLLQSLGAIEALSACEPCHGIVSAWGRTMPALQPAILNPFGHAWFIHRARFDSCLQDKARDSGSTWMSEEAHVHFDTHGVSITTTGLPVRARWLIFATGSPSWPARITQQKPSKMDSMIAFWAYIPAHLQERLLFVEPSDRGWWYLCPADGPGAIACFVTDPLSARSLAPSKPANWNQLLHVTSLSLQLHGDKAAERVHVALTGLAALPQTHGPRWIAVGDAAAKLDPLGSSGTTTAIHAGQLAGQAVADALQGNTASLDRYGRWSTGLVQEFTRQRHQQYAVEATSRSVGFWQRRVDSRLPLSAAA